MSLVKRFVPFILLFVNFAMKRVILIFNARAIINDLANPMSTTSLYCDDKITLNQHDELTLFLGV
jgi:hypothetical protein